MSRQYGALPANGDQRTATEQMHDLYRLALDARMFGAAGWLERHFPWDKGHGHCCPPKLVKDREERLRGILAETFNGDGRPR